MSAVLLLHHLRKKRWQEEAEGEEKEPPHRQKMKIDTASSVPSDCAGPASKRSRTWDTSTEAPRRTVVHQLFDASTSVMYTVHETADEESGKSTNGTSSLSSRSESCTLTTSAPSMNNCPPCSRSRQPASVTSVMDRAPARLSHPLCGGSRFCGVNQLHNKKIQTTIKPKVRTVVAQRNPRQVCGLLVHPYLDEDAARAPQTLVDIIVTVVFSAAAEENAKKHSVDKLFRLYSNMQKRRESYSLLNFSVKIDV